MEINGYSELPSDFILKNINEFIEKQGRNPALIIMSKDVIRSLYREIQRKGVLPPDKDKLFSITMILEERIAFGGTEVVICGGKERFALI